MSLNLALNNALSGLHINQQSLAVLSQNIANVNTEGYTRKTQQQEPLYVGGMGNGVMVGDVVRTVDSYLERALQTQGSELGRSSTVKDYYDRMQVFLGQPGASNSVDHYLTGFLNAYQQMADTPEQVSYRSNMMNAAESLAENISSLATSLNDLRFQADQGIQSGLTVVNNALKKLYDLNVAIGRTTGSGQSVAGLLDQRDMALADVAEYLDVLVDYDEDGRVNIASGSGAQLLDGQLHQLRYAGAVSVDSFINDNQLSAIGVIGIDSNGNESGNLTYLTSSATSALITSTIHSGKLKGFLDVRDTILPQVLDQLDALSANLRDTVNAVHNDGSGFPAAESLMGTREIYPQDRSDWSGSVRIAVLDSAGQAVGSSYDDEAALRPLTLDLASLNDGENDGYVSMQTVADAINDYFGIAGAKAKLGNLNNIQLVSDTLQLPNGLTNLFNFDFQLDNASGSAASFFVHGFTVTDDTGADITNLSQDVPSVAVSSVNSYTTTNGSALVDVNLMSVAGLATGDRIYLDAPSSAAATAMGLATSDLQGYFTIQGISGTRITIEASNAATLTGSTSDATPASLYPPYAMVEGGERLRTRTDGGELQLDLSGNTGTQYYTISATIDVLDPDGNVSSSQVSYRIPNGVTEIYNDAYDATAVTGDGVRVLPNTTQPSLRAILVNDDGQELAKVNGNYIDAPCYLKLVGGQEGYTVALDEMDSAQLGDVSGGTGDGGTGWGFSHFFGLNNFFAANSPTDTGDALQGSAVKLAVEQRLIDNPNLVSTGELKRQEQSADSSAPPDYTYVRYAGDNSVAQRIANLGSQEVAFVAAGGLSSGAMTMGTYASQILAFTASLASAAEDSANTVQNLYDGFKARSSAVSGVNLDEELASSVVFQNAYAATARIVTAVNKMYDDLLQMVG